MILVYSQNKVPVQRGDVVLIGGQLCTVSNFVPSGWTAKVYVVRSSDDQTKCHWATQIGMEMFDPDAQDDDDVGGNDPFGYC